MRAPWLVSLVCLLVQGGRIAGIGAALAVPAGTTELEMFGDPRALPAAKAQRESLAPAAVADLWSAGTLATVPRGHGTQFGFPVPTLTRPEEADAFVAAGIAEGSDFLKIVIEDGSALGQTTPSLRADTVAALVKAAHGRGRMVVAHVSTQADAAVALAGGVDGLVHVAMDRAPAPYCLARMVMGCAQTSRYSTPRSMSFDSQTISTS